jgi:hypothetical protein
MKDWQTSVGSTEELKFALANGIDIIFDSDDLTQFLIGDVL